MRFSTDTFAAAVGLALGLAFIPAAHATPITYAFTVTATTGPLAGSISSGTFTYDSSAIVPGGFNAGTGLFSALDFTWHGIHYDQTTANTGELTWDASGNLLLWLFGTNCHSASCDLFAPGSEGWNIAGFNNFNYNAGTAGGGIGTVTRSQVTPEPSSFALAIFGLGGLAWVRRRQHALRR